MASQGAVQQVSEATRIVPMYEADVSAPPAATPAHLTYRGGPLLAAVEVFTVFWGAAWETGSDAQLVTRLNDFFDAIVSSALLDQLGEYSVASYQIGHGKRIGTTNVLTPNPATSVDDSRIQQMLENQIMGNASFPKPGADTLYFVFLPSGVTVSQGGSTSCQEFCGYHNNTGSGTYYAVMPYPACAGCTGTLQTFDALTSTVSHELCEAITDPVPGEGWYDDTHGEIGDICAWRTKTVGTYTVQLEWSNERGQCV